METDIAYPQLIAFFRGKYSWLSNMYSAPVKIGDGLTYPSRENAYQAQKFEDLSFREQFTKISSREAKEIGKTARGIRSDWKFVKEGVMKDVVFFCFDQNPDLKEKLLATGSAILRETNTWGDTYWGVCSGRGANRLGQILMDVRYQLSVIDSLIKATDKAEED